MEKHFFNPDGAFYDPDITSEKSKEISKTIMPLVKKYRDEGYPLSEILHLVVATIEFDNTMTVLSNPTEVRGKNGFVEANSMI